MNLIHGLYIRPALDEESHTAEAPTFLEDMSQRRESHLRVEK